MTYFQTKSLSHLKDHYVVLDIPRIVDQTKLAKTAPYVSDIFSQYSVIHPRHKDRSRKRRVRNPTTGELEERQDETPQVSNTQNNNRDGDVVNTFVNESEPGDSGGPSDAIESVNNKIQIVDLHGDNPIISYQGNFYSCKWASSIGSDLIFAKKPEDPDSDRKALYSLPSWDLLDVGSARLIASNAQIDRRAPAEKYDIESRLNNAENVQDGASSSTVRQTNFLTRLREIQVTRGEVDPSTARGAIAPRQQRRRGGRPRRGRSTVPMVTSGQPVGNLSSLYTSTPESWDAMDITRE
jgi:hypothetical protein